VLETSAPGGPTRLTHVWFAEADGAIWIESATPERPFYLDLAARPDLVLERRDSPWSGTRRLRGRAGLVPEPGGHASIRELLAARYGWADDWVAMLTDTSGSRAVRVVLEDGGAN
jgi:hypothetical protein